MFKFRQNSTKTTKIFIHFAKNALAFQLEYLTIIIENWIKGSVSFKSTKTTVCPGKSKKKIIKAFSLNVEIGQFDETRRIIRINYFQTTIQQKYKLSVILLYKNIYLMYSSHEPYTYKL